MVSTNHNKQPLQCVVNSLKAVFLLDYHGTQSQFIQVYLCTLRYKDQSTLRGPQIYDCVLHSVTACPIKLSLRHCV